MKTFIFEPTLNGLIINIILLLESYPQVLFWVVYYVCARAKAAPSSEAQMRCSI